MKHEPITKIPTVLINSVKLDIINTQRKLIQITDRDTRSVVQHGYELLFGNNERIRVLYDLDLITEEEFLSHMEEQNRLKDKLRRITANKNGLNRVRIESSPDEN